MQTAPNETPWIDRYLITSTTGRIYTRKMVYNRCLKMCGPGNGPGIRALLDSPDFMTGYTGTVPSFVAFDVLLTLSTQGNLK